MGKGEDRSLRAPTQLSLECSPYSLFMPCTSCLVIVMVRTWWFVEWCGEVSDLQQQVVGFAGRHQAPTVTQTCRHLTPDIIHKKRGESGGLCNGKQAFGSQQRRGHLSRHLGR